MTGEAYRREVRRRYESLTPTLQEYVNRRALQREVFAWDTLTIAQLDRVLGAVVVASLLSE